jgi:hypothetical protein
LSEKEAADAVRAIGGPEGRIVKNPPLAQEVLLDVAGFGHFARRQLLCALQRLVNRNLAGKGCRDASVPALVNSYRLEFPIT